MDLKNKIITAALSLSASIVNSPLHAAQEPSDAQSVMILQTVNNGEIALARLAKKSDSKDVRDFADQMIQQHSKSNKDLDKLLKSQQIKPSNSTTSFNLRKEADQKKQALSALTGRDFNSKYIESQIEMHSKVLDLLDKTLIPQASNAELKDLLKKTRDVVAAHREHAIKISHSAT